MLTGAPAINSDDEDGSGFKDDNVCVMFPLCSRRC